MAILDDLRQAVTNAVSAGADAARAQGTALRGDFENLVRPQLDGVLVQVAAITSDFVDGNISQEQAQSDLATQCNRIRPIIIGAAELELLAVQTIIKAVLDALKAAVKGAAGVAIL